MSAVGRAGGVLVATVLLCGCGGARPRGLDHLGAQGFRVPSAASPTIAPPPPPAAPAPTPPSAPVPAPTPPPTPTPLSTPTAAASATLSLAPHPFPSQVPGGEVLTPDMQACSIIALDFLDLAPGPTLDAQVRADAGPLNASQRSQLESVLVHSDAVAKAIAHMNTSSVNHNSSAQDTAFRKFLAGCPQF